MFKTFRHHLGNIPGWRTNRKIVVIESDDWGSIRMPSKEVYQQFLNNGIRVDKDPFCRYDCLATKKDLEELFEVLTSVKDRNGRHPVLTANTVVANPDFEKIKSSNFTKYFYEPFTETLKKSITHDGAFELWRQGMQAGLFHPQFHGREHLNIKKWLRDLQSDVGVTRLSFDMGTYGLTAAVDNHIKDNYMGAFNSGLTDDIQKFKSILKEGLDLFEKIFGFRSESFIATTYTWSPKIETFLKDDGVKYLQGMIHQRIPLDDDTKFRYKKNNFQGTKSKEGLIYLIRNCFFEPSQNPEFDWINDCLKRIKIAFLYHKPVTISMHRLNIIGGIDEDNRYINTILFKKLLLKIVRQYPDVEFMSSDELGRIIESDH